MRNLKKFLALVLAFMMTMSLMVTVNASNVEKAPDADKVTVFQEAIDVLMGMGIIRGSDDGAINPKSNISRAEMAAFIYRLYTGDVKGDKEFLYKETATGFSDVDMNEWFAGPIGFCASNRFITGSEGKFRPKENVTGYEALVMILRAMGYDKEEGEMTGNPEWKQIAHTRALNVGLFNGVNESNYEYSLIQPATREFVCQLLFQAAQRPMVTYNRGYINNYDYMNAATGVRNQTLGGWRFGLDSRIGIVVGNQATGETGTKISFNANYTANKENSADDAYSYLSNIGFGGVNYFYNGVNSDGTSKLNPGTVTVAFYDNRATDKIIELETAKTDLGNFNHQVKVWYDNRSGRESARFQTSAYYSSLTGSVSSGYTTYSIIDQANPNRVVVDDTNDSNAAKIDTYTAGGPVDNLGEKLANLGYHVPTTGITALYNYAFAPMESLAANGGDDVTSVTNSKASPIKVNNGSDAHGLYLIVSNGNDPVTGKPNVDVIISLELTLTEVQEDNKYQNPNSFGVLNSNKNSSTSTGVAHFGTGGGLGNNANNTEDIATFDTYKTYLNIARSHLLGGTEAKDLTKYDKVAAIAVTGTAGRKLTDMQGTFYDIDDYNTGNAPKITDNTPPTGSDRYDLEPNQFYYQLNKLENKVTGVVKYIYPDNSVTIDREDGSEWVTLPQSVFAEATDGTFAGTRERGVHDMQVNERYDFYVDHSNDSWLFYERNEPEGTKFVYNTYMDWQTEFISSEFNYGMSYVGTEGVVDKQEHITKIDKQTIGNKDDQLNYADILMPKREVNGTGGNPLLGSSSGVIPGIYKGYMLNSKNELVSVTTDDDKLTGFYQASANNFGYGDGSGAGVIKITSSNATVGVKEFGDKTEATVDADPRSRLAFTNDTKFYFVSGTGNSTNVTTKTLKELAGMEIHVDGGFVDYVNGDAVGNLLNKDGIVAGNKYDMVYYSIDTGTKYAQIIRGGAQPVAEVFIPLACLKGATATVSGAKVFFVGDSSDVVKKNSNDNGATAATMFNVFNTKDGTKESVWIRGYYDGTGRAADDPKSDAEWIYSDLTRFVNSANENDNMFIKLVPTDDKAHDGATIYALTDLTSGDIGNIVGRYWVVKSEGGNNFVAESDNRYGEYDYGQLAGQTNGMFKPSYAPGEAYGYIQNVNNSSNDDGETLVRIDKAHVINLNETRYPNVSTPHDLLWASSIEINGGMVGVSYYMSNTDTVGVAFINVPF